VESPDTRAARRCPLSSVNSVKRRSMPYGRNRAALPAAIPFHRRLKAEVARLDDARVHRADWNFVNALALHANES